jgi:hypothetical protein
MLDDAPIWVLVLLVIAMWLMWAVTVALTRLEGARSVISNARSVISNDHRSNLEPASPSAEVVDAQPQAQEAARGDAAAAVHGLPASRNPRDGVAGGAPTGSVGRRGTDVREHRAGARDVPVVQEAMQPGGRREGGRRTDEPKAEDRAGAGELPRPASLDSGRAVVFHTRPTLGIEFGWWCESCHEGRTQLNGFGAAVGAQLHNAELHP